MVCRVGAMKIFNRKNPIIKMTAPVMLKYRCTMAVRLAFLLVPTDEIRDVTQVPIFCPSTIGIAA